MGEHGPVLAVVQARMSSTRLPGKVLAPILGQPMILRQLERSARARSLDAVMVATSVDASDDILARTMAEAGVRLHRGSLSNVLERYRTAVQAYEAAEGPVAHVMRLTADCPLIDPEIIDEVAALHFSVGGDYASNTFDRSYADGLDTEIFTRATLDRLAREARTPQEFEHVTAGVAMRRPEFHMAQLVQEPDRSRLRWTVDRPDDLEFVRRVYGRLYPEKPDFGWRDILALGPDFERYEG